MLRAAPNYCGNMLLAAAKVRPSTINDFEMLDHLWLELENQLFIMANVGKFCQYCKCGHGPRLSTNAPTKLKH